MKKHCQNPLCKRKCAREVTVSVEGLSGETRSLCEACRVAFDWGVQHGQMLRKRKKVWVVAVSRDGLVFHTKAVASQRKAVQALAAYLRTEQGYVGPAKLPAICDWMAEHDERLGADIICASLDLN